MARKERMGSGEAPRRAEVPFSWLERSAESLAG
jgi:hypothetical protein